MITQLLVATLVSATSGSLPETGEIPGVFESDTTPTVFLVSPAERRACHSTGTVCVAPGGSTTMAGIELVDSGTPVTVLARGTQVAAKGQLGTPSGDQPWQVEMVARFRAPSDTTPVIVAIFDRDDPGSIERKEAKVVWTVNMSPGRDLGMHFLLTPEDGFEASHTYLARVVQTKAKSERVLAEGVFHLE
jgi:hypothetical protein